MLNIRPAGLRPSGLESHCSTAFLFSSTYYLVLEDLFGSVTKLFQGALQFTLPRSILRASEGFDLRWWTADKGPNSVFTLGEHTGDHVGGHKAGLA
jgi:hypothetical protein